MKFFSLFLFITLPAFSSDTLKPGVLRWGADAEGGAPYIMPDPGNAKNLIGFEVDLADALAHEMGLTAEFIQNQWDALIPGLQRGNYDLGLNGLEITEDRQREVAFSNPYYKTFEQITVHKDNTTIQNLTDLSGKKVGTLTGSVAQRILKALGGVEIVEYDGQNTAYEDLSIGRVEAVLMDWPIAIVYADPNAKLKAVGPPIGELFYGIAVKKENPALLKKVNQALTNLQNSGKLRAIYADWGLWNDEVAHFFNDPAPLREKPEKLHHYLDNVGWKKTWKDKISQYSAYLPLLGIGALKTLQISFFAMLLAMFAGVLLTLGRMYLPGPGAWVVTAFIEAIRGTPLLIQLFLIFYGLPRFGIELTPLLAAIIGLGLNYAACEAENYRAGLLSIPKSQFEAAGALGMTRFQTLRHVVLPQAVRVVIPPSTNDFIALLKDSSLVSVITMVELTKVYGQLASANFDYFGLGILVAAIYFMMGLPFIHLAKKAEKKFSMGFIDESESHLTRRKQGFGPRTGRGILLPKALTSAHHKLNKLLISRSN